MFLTVIPFLTAYADNSHPVEMTCHISKGIFLTRFTTISGMAEFGSKLAKISQLTAQKHPLTSTYKLKSVTSIAITDAYL